MICEVFRKAIYDGSGRAAGRYAGVLAGRGGTGRYRREGWGGLRRSQGWVGLGGDGSSTHLVCE